MVSILEDRVTSSQFGAGTPDLVWGFGKASLRQWHLKCQLKDEKDEKALGEEGVPWVG